jgi:hypothetical protein
MFSTSYSRLVALIMLLQRYGITLYVIKAVLVVLSVSLRSNYSSELLKSVFLPQIERSYFKILLSVLRSWKTLILNRKIWTIIAFLDFYLKHNVSATGICLRL